MLFETPSSASKAMSRPLLTIAKEAVTGGNDTGLSANAELSAKSFAGSGRPEAILVDSEAVDL
jgi:hypothetical protein